MKNLILVITMLAVSANFSYSAPYLNGDPGAKNKLEYMMKENGRYLIGMTKGEISRIYGFPYNKSLTQTGKDTFEQWQMYRDESTYLYFKNDKLTSFSINN